MGLFTPHWKSSDSEKRLKWIAKADPENRKQSKIIENLALNDVDDDVSRTATRKVKDETVLVEIIDSQYNLDRIKIAISRINNLKLLESLETDDEIIAELIAKRISTMKNNSKTISRKATDRNQAESNQPRQETGMNKIITSYAKQNSDLKTGAAEAMKTSPDFIKKEYAFGLPYYSNNLARLYVVRALIAETKKDASLKAKVIRELPTLITDGFPPAPLWAAIAYAHISDGLTSDQLSSHSFSSLSFSNDEALFLYNGLKNWKTDDEVFTDFVQRLKQSAQQSDSYVE